MLSSIFFKSSISSTQLQSFKINLMTLSLLALPTYVSASNLYNTAFLSNDISNIADLSRFDEGKQPEGRYYADLYVNDQFIASRYLNFIASKDQNTSSGLIPCFDIATLNQMNINSLSISADQHSQCILLTDLIEDAQTDYNFHNQQLKITIPQASLANQIRGYIPESEFDFGIPAALFNYNFSGVTGGDSDSQFLSLNSGINLGKWRLRNNSSWINNKINDKNHSKWSNINSYAQRAIIPLKSEITFGDYSSSNDIFDSIGFRGVRLSSSANMHPESLQGFAPTVRGTVNTRAKVSITQNGYVIYQNTVSPGPFVISDLSPTQNSGDLTVSIEEENGQQRTFLVPYSTIPLLQREGQYKYEVIAGELRSGNDLKSNPKFIQGSVITGLSNGFTIYAGTQLSDKYQSYSSGFGKNLGKYGAVSLDATHANTELIDQSNYQGQSYRFLYAKSLNQLGTTFQLLGYRYSTKGFYTLDESSYKLLEGYDSSQLNKYDPKYDFNNDSSYLGAYHNLGYRKKGNFQLNISQNLQTLGSLYASANVQSYWNSHLESRSIQAGYSNSWRDLFYTLSWAQTESILGNSRSEKYHSIALNLAMPLHTLFRKNARKKNWIDNTYLSTSAYQNNDGNMSWQTNLSGTLLENKNLSYNISQNYNDKSHYSASAGVQYQSSYAQMGLGYSDSNNKNSINYQISGGVLAHEDGITLSQPLGTTNILVEAKNAKNVDVYNQTGISTDSRGYAVVPHASSYRLNRVALDANSLDSRTEITHNVQNIVPTEGAVVRAKFNTQIGYRALIKLTYRGNNVPFASTVQVVSTQLQSMVGEQGQVFLSGLPKQGEILVKWGNTDSDQCQAVYDLTTTQFTKNNSMISMELDCE